MNIIHHMNLRATDLNLFVVFDALLDTQSVSKAAKRIGLSQPATSNALARLRAIFGDPLFVRRGAAMLPTARSQQIAAHIRAGLSHLDRALAPPEGFDPSTAEHTFVVGAHDFAALLILPSLLAQVRTQAPGITLRIVRMGSLCPYTELEKGSLDLVFAAAINVPRSIACEIPPPIPLATAVRVGHPRVHQRLTLRQFVELDHLLVAPLGGDRSPVDLALKKRGYSRRIALTVPDFLLAPHIVARTDLLVTLPRKVFDLVQPAGGLNLFKTPIQVKRVPYACLWDKRREFDAAHIWLRDMVRPTLVG
ncbi:MAG TPA: LysR family transcriptional regulator [Nannocystis exedens]|nr:LysR family transcriptional regulator [Nannocystis exedens]